MTPTNSTPEHPHVVVLGGGYAGVLAAQRLAGRLPRGASITLVSEGDELVHRVRLHEALAGRAFSRYPLRALLAPRVAVRRARVRAVSTAAKTVTFEDGATLSYDALVCALGSAVSLRAPGAAKHADGLRDVSTAMRDAARLAALPEGARVTVVGGGMTGVEVAAEIAEAHPRLVVTLVCDRLFADFSDEARRHLREALAALRVTVREGVTVREVTDVDVALSDDARLPSSLTVWAAGFDARAPEVTADWPLDARGRIAVDESLAVPGADGVFAAGDAAASAPGVGESLRMGCVTAMPMGAHAADGALRYLRGEGARPFSFGFVVRCVSLGRRRGLVQFVDALDRPTPRVLTGASAALVKEAICRFVMGAPRVEARLPGFYRWSRGVEAAAS